MAGHAPHAADRDEHHHRQLGLLPTALAIGLGAKLQAPLAIAVFGRLLSATVLTFVVISVAYNLLAEAGERIRAFFGRPAAVHAEPEAQVQPGLAAGD